MRPKLLLSLALVAAVLTAAVPAGAQSAEQDRRAAEQAARQIELARNRATAAAGALARAETEFARVEDELEQVEADRQVSEQRLGSIRSDLQELALQRYTRGDVTSIPLALSNTDLSAQVRADAMLRLFALGSNDAIDEFQRVGEDLESQNKRLASTKKRSEKTLAALDAARKQLDGRIVELQIAEKDRQSDAAVRRILDARRAEALKREQAAAAAEAARGVAVAPRGARAGGAPAARPAAPPATGGMVCPVAGPSAFVDTWGAARSGGRRHEGVDMLGSRGTPLVAAVAGTAQPSTNRLGGNAVWLRGANGYSYYYAHLNSFGASGAVGAGTVIGYMGDTGNARGTVHLHFEVHPGGGRAVNPTPYVRAVC